MKKLKRLNCQIIPDSSKGWKIKLEAKNKMNNNIKQLQAIINTQSKMMEELKKELEQKDTILNDLCSLTQDQMLKIKIQRKKLKELEKQDWYFIFGGSHAHPNGYVKIFDTFNGAREEMFRRYGSRWCTQHDESYMAKIIKEYDMHEVE